MKKIYTLGFILTMLAFTVTNASATATAVLYDWYVDVNGNGSTIPTYQASEVYKAPLVGGAITGVNGFAYNVTYQDENGNDILVPNALGNVNMKFSGAGRYIVVGYFDIEMTEGENTYFDESGEYHGVTAAGQFGEVGDRDSQDINGDYYYQKSDDQYGDIALRMGWDFTLQANQYATILFAITDTAPASGFYLSQTDHARGRQNPESVYLASILDIKNEGGKVAEPATATLLGLGLLGLLGFRTKEKRQ